MTGEVRPPERHDAPLTIAEAKRRLALPVGIEELGAQPLRHVEIELLGAALPSAADRVGQVEFQSGAIERGLARQFLDLQPPRGKLRTLASGSLMATLLAVVSMMGQRVRSVRDWSSEVVESARETRFLQKPGLALNEAFWVPPVRACLRSS